MIAEEEQPGSSAAVAATFLALQWVDLGSGSSGCDFVKLSASSSRSNARSCKVAGECVACSEKVAALRAVCLISSSGSSGGGSGGVRRGPR